jgi:magnesium transporter
MLEKLARPEVLELIEMGDRDTLADFLNRWVPPDLAGLISTLGHEPQRFVLESLSPALAALTFVYLDMRSQERILKALPRERAAKILDDMAPDDRTALLEEFPNELRDRYLGQMSPEARAIASRLLEYPEDTIGRLMTPDYLAIHTDWTIKRVLDYVRTHGKKSETLGVLYVVDAEGKLIDDIGMGKFLLAPLHAHVHELMNSKFVGLKVTDDKRTAVEVFRKYDRTALPVVNVEGHLVGIVTIDDVLDVAEEEATRELQQFGGVEALDAPYIATPFFELVRKRASWLVVLFIGEMLTATAMGFFEREIEKAVVLALFVPLIISSGGNSGSQAATLIIRALALGEVKLRDWWRVMRRELASGLMLGVILGTIGFIRIAAWSAFSKIYGPHWFLVALTVGFSLIGIVLWGTLSGAMLPFLLRKLGFDPAASSAPFVATLVDVTGLVIYFSVALVILHGTLL